MRFSNEDYSSRHLSYKSLRALTTEVGISATESRWQSNLKRVSRVQRQYLLQLTSYHDLSVSVDTTVVCDELRECRHPVICPKLWKGEANRLASSFCPSSTSLRILSTEAHGNASRHHLSMVATGERVARWYAYTVDVS